MTIITTITTGIRIIMINNNGNTKDKNNNEKKKKRKNNNKKKVSVRRIVLDWETHNKMTLKNLSF